MVTRLESDIIPFPRRREQAKASGIRAAHVAGRWCVERVVDGVVIRRVMMPKMADAYRIAARIGHRDQVAVLPTRFSRSGDVGASRRGGMGDRS